MRRTLAEWASIAEILGAFAIVVSLIFVGFQIRENTRATQAATYQQHTQYEIEFLEKVGSDPSLATLWAAVQPQNEPVQLEGAEREQARWLNIAVVRLWESLYLQHQAGTLSEDGWAAREPLIRSWLTGPNLLIDPPGPDNVAWAGSFAEYWRTLLKEREN